MIRSIANLKHHRRGTVAVLACILMIALLGMVAFAVDLGYLATSQAELQRSADASALAACYQLVYKGTPGTPVDLTTNVQNVPVSARQYAGLNHVCSSAPGLANSDIVVGFMADPNQSGGTIDTGVNINAFNSVQVTVRRSADENGQVPSFFGKIFGVNGTTTKNSATAAFISNFGGFTMPQSSSGNSCLMIMPFALDLDTWNACLGGDTSVTTDIWNCLSNPGQVAYGKDGVREFNLFPQGTESPGNRGTVDIGAPNNSTSDIVRQILHGISDTDLSYFDGSTIKFAEDNTLTLQGDTGISAGFADALKAIIGQKRIIPIFSKCEEPGDNAVYTIVCWTAVEICHVNLSGSMSSKHVTVQPCTMTIGGGVANTSPSTTTSYYIYSPIHLVK